MAGLAELESGIPITVHGSAGTLDLVVPPGASVWDVAREYAELADLPSIPLIYTRAGEALPPTGVLADHGIDTGDLLVAASSAYRPRGRRDGGVQQETRHNPLVALWCSLAALGALLAGWLSAQQGAVSFETATIRVLLAAAVVGVLPLGRYTAERAVAAPAFAAAAAFALVWQPSAEHYPTIVGATALAAAVTAGVARALDDRADEGLRVWIAAGLTLFLIGAGSALLDLPLAATWAVLAVLAMLAARFVPMFAIDVPDQYLIDLQRLAASAWSAREKPQGTRGRTVVPVRAVQVVAASGARTVTAASVAIAVVSMVSTTLLLQSSRAGVDLIGTRVLVFCVGASLLLAARSYRHAAARGLLRVGGLHAWLVLFLSLFASMPSGRLFLVFGISAALGVVLVVAAVATGRGWRSVRWSRRAELAESLTGAGAVASLFVATTMFRGFMEFVARHAPS